MRVRYTRWYLRLWAAVWPPARRKLRMIERVLEDQQDELERAALALELGGTAYYKVRWSDPGKS